MICERCLVDKTIIVTIRFAITKFDPRTGRESRVTIERRLCCACGGAEAVLDGEPAVLREAPLDVEGDEQAELELGAAR